MKLKGKILISIISGLLLIVAAVFGTITLFAGAKSDGYITITVIDYEGNEIESKEVGFNKGETFVEVLSKSGLDFELSEAHPTWGASVLVIKGIPLGEFQWWSHSRNGTASEFGVSSQPFDDGDVFVFQVMSWAE